MRYKVLANCLLDYVLEKDGVLYTLEMLAELGFNERELLEIGFDTDTINSVLK